MTRIAGRIPDSVLIAAPGAAVRLDSAVPGHRPPDARRRRRHPGEDHPRDDEDTVTLHDASGADEADGPDPVEALRRGGFRKPA